MLRCQLIFEKRYEHKLWVNYTGCLNSIRRTYRPIREVNNLQLILRQLTKNEDEFVHARNKRGVFNFIGGISKLLFGTLDAEDANYYTDKISQLENEVRFSETFKGTDYGGKIYPQIH